MPNRISALFECESAPVAQWIEQLTSEHPGRCAVAPSVSGGAKRAETSALFGTLVKPWPFAARRCRAMPEPAPDAWLDKGVHGAGVTWALRRMAGQGRRATPWMGRRRWRTRVQTVVVGRWCCRVRYRGPARRKETAWTSGEGADRRWLVHGSAGSSSLPPSWHVSPPAQAQVLCRRPR